MTDALLILANALLLVIVLVSVAEFVHLHQRSIQSWWFTVRRRVFGK